ncbi:hypothetical protein GCM10010149_59310 [Nonomuraea roseoviolacea subsp. roseoviolacea]
MAARGQLGEQICRFGLVRLIDEDHGALKDVAILACSVMRFHLSAREDVCGG